MSDSSPPESLSPRAPQAHTLSPAADLAPHKPCCPQREDGSYLISGWMPALQLAELLGITLPASRPYQTFAGFLLQEFGAVPNVGDKVEALGWRFEIVDLDGRRIDKVLASRLETS